MTAQGTQGGAPSSETLALQKLAESDSLDLEKSLLRLTDNARSLGTTVVTVVGIALSAVGLGSIGKLADRPLPLILAVIAIITAIAAVLVSIWAMMRRSRLINMNNLVDVRAWYDEQARHALRANTAAWLLMGGVLLGGVAALIAVLDANPSYQVGLQSAGLGDQSTVSVKAAASDVDEGSLVAVRVTGKDASGAETVLAQSSRTADANGAATIDASLTGTGHFRSFTVVLTADGEPRASMTIPAP